MASADRLIEVFNEAKARVAGAERERFVAEACRDELALKAQVLVLLQAHDGAGDFLKHAQLASPASLLTEKPGDRIGRYKLLQQIGEGGCGVVYMAEQEEPVRRRVALKVIKLGMDTKQVIARFEAERQALALMDHPNIAKVLDAGATESPTVPGAPSSLPGSGGSELAGRDAGAPRDAGAALPAGRPYFVMELVRGIKITEFCDENRLSTQDRLKLFIQVCQAIQHAHQKGVIHRDIKPSNILVTINDGVPVPKVIDFGIAKATQGRLTDQTLFTAFEQFIGTPAYMSPEQAVLTSLDIDTRSDIYSLGVLLYELLTGRTPFDAKELLSAGLDEMRRTILEQEPPKPSKVVERESELRVERAGARAMGGLALNPQLKSLSTDLDWIVMKSLEKDRARRYETANGLAMDIERHLHDEPVIARPPSALYRLQKSVRRNKTAFAAATAIATVLVIGVVVSTWEAIRATRAEREQSRSRQIAQQAQADEARQRQEAVTARTRAEADEKKAETEAAKSRQVAAFLKQMLEGVDPGVALGRDTTVLREILDKAAGRLGSELGNQPEVELELRNTIGRIYCDLGDRVRAEAVLRDAPAMARKLWGNDDLRLARSLQSLAIASSGKSKEVEDLYREVLAIRRKALGNESEAVGESLRDLGSFLRAQGRLAEAERYERDSLAILVKLWPEGHPQVAFTLADLAIVLALQGRWPEAEAADREALAMSTKLSGEENLTVANSSSHLGFVLMSQGKLAEAEPVYRKALAMQIKLFGREYPRAADSLGALVGVLVRERKSDEVEPLFNDVLTPAFLTQPKSSGLLRARGDCRARMGHWTAAAADFSRLVELEPKEHLNFQALAALQVQVGDFEGYRKTCQQMVTKFHGTEDPNIADRMAKDCLILPDSGADLSAAGAWADTAVTAGKDSGDLPWFQFCKGLAEYRQGHFAGAVDWLQKVLAHAGDNSDRDVEACMVLAMAQYRSKQGGESRAALAKGVEIAERKLPKLDGGDLGDGWLDWIIAHALMREARVLIPPPAAAAPK